MNRYIFKLVHKISIYLFLLIIVDDFIVNNYLNFSSHFLLVCNCKHFSILPPSPILIYLILDLIQIQKFALYDLS